LKGLQILRPPYRDIAIAHAAPDDWGAKGEWEEISTLLQIGRAHMGAISVYRQLRKFDREFMNQKTRYGITTLAISQINNVKIELKVVGDGNYIPKTITVVRIDENVFIGHFGGPGHTIGVGSNMDLATLRHDLVEERGF
jgi:hypothetical protein